MCIQLCICFSKAANANICQWLVQRSLHEWQRLLRSAEVSFNARAAWSARQQLYQNQQHALIGYHKQQATNMQHKYLAGQYNVLSQIRHRYHSGTA